MPVDWSSLRRRWAARCGRRTAAGAGVALGLLTAGAAAAEPFPVQLAGVLAHQGASSAGWPAGIDPSAVRAAYRAAAHRPIWLRDGAAPAPALVQTLEAAGRHGLVPGDYDADRLARAVQRDDAGDARVCARLKVRLTAAFLRYAGDLRHRRPAFRPARAGAPDPEVAALLNAVRAARAVGVHLAELAPGHAGYRKLAQALRRYQSIQSAGGWPRVPDGPALSQGDRGARVAVLQRRLAGGGGLAGYDPTPARFDAALTAAVRRFQARHGLVQDGVVAARTLAALNVSAGARARQITRNPERLRWNRPPDGPSVRVNVPASGWRCWTAAGRS